MNHCYKSCVISGQQWNNYLLYHWEGGTVPHSGAYPETFWWGGTNDRQNCRPSLPPPPKKKKEERKKTKKRKKKEKKKGNLMQE